METLEQQAPPSPAPVLESVPLKRIFKYEKDGEVITLEDINPLWPEQEIIKFYCSEYPELTNAKIEKPEDEGMNRVYNITTTVGTKG